MIRLARSVGVAGSVARRGSVTRAVVGAGLWIALLLLPSGAMAQARAIRVIAPTCTPGWWSAAAFDAALAVEIVALGLALSPSAGDAIAVELPCDTASAHARLRAVVGAVTIERDADLSDVAPAVRMRILALGAHDALAEAIATNEVRAAAEASAGAEGDASAEADANADASASASVGANAGADASAGAVANAGAGAEANASADAGASAGAEPDGGADAGLGIDADARRAASALGVPTVPRAPSRPVALGLRGRVAVLPGAVLAGGPVLEVEVALASLPIAITAGVAGGYAASSHALGEVRGGWADLLVGGRAFVDLAPIRLDASLALALAYTHTEGASTRTDVVIASRDAFAVALEPAIAASIALVPELRVVLAAGARIWLLGHDARAADRRGLAFVDAAPFVELGVAIAP